MLILFMSILSKKTSNTAAPKNGEGKLELHLQVFIVGVKHGRERSVLHIHPLHELISLQTMFDSVLV